MRKTRTFPGLLAFMIASVTVLGHQINVSDVEFYISPWPGPNCEILVNNSENLCDGDKNQCSIIYQGNIYYVSSMAIDGPCNPSFKE